MLEEIMYVSQEGDDAPMGLLLMAGYLREDFPWLSEVLAESYREVREGGSDVAEKAMHRLQRTVKTLMRSKFSREMIGDAKEAHFIIEEIPMLIDMSLHHLIDSRKRSKQPSNDEKSGD
ncbi:hypothetical protein PGB28_18075 [Primorskyibacter aestuariivivens]|uniref:hypothetical protein n=1 Tax=Primorskyibacter aestuariivivens TaxID=1888912 RepID=UPI002301F094|nr:hypothetical protein [Primorskyibacter aestuariivivens]MDA7430373.1 hypothetical protein [Primorskyibacter aestuariivivens]